MEVPLPANASIMLLRVHFPITDKFESETLIALLDDPQTTEPESWTPIARAILNLARNQSQTMNIPMTPNILNGGHFSLVPALAQVFCTQHFACKRQ